MKCQLLVDHPTQTHRRRIGGGEAGSLQGPRRLQCSLKFENRSRRRMAHPVADAVSIPTVCSNGPLHASQTTALLVVTETVVTLFNSRYVLKLLGF